MLSVRSSLQVTMSVWRALFIRESLGRIFSSRAAWFWLLAEPIFNISYLYILFTIIHVHTIGGVDAGVWIIVGMLAFFLFRRTAVQMMNAIRANQSLFAYRQVKPVDAVIVRGLLEAAVMIFISIVVLTMAALLDLEVIPDDPLMVFEGLLGCWLLGVGFGLIMSVVGELVPELEKVVSMAMLPLYVLSGVMYSIAAVPPPFRGMLMWNPVAQGLELVRQGYSPYYHAAPELNPEYLFAVALVSVFLGLALHRKFALRIITK